MRGFAGTFEEYAVLQFLIGVGVALENVLWTTFVYALFPPKERGRALGPIIGSNALGRILGLGLTPRRLVLLGSWQNVFSFYGGLHIIFAVSVYTSLAVFHCPRVWRELVRVMGDAFCDKIPSVLA